LTEAAVTGHFPGTNQKVTPYWGAVNFDSPRYFKAFCDEKERRFGRLFNPFDVNGDGQITFGEVNEASLKWDATPGDATPAEEPALAIRNELAEAWKDDPLENKIETKIGEILLIKFNVADADNDQSLDMNEFADYATILYDAIGFYSKALRKTNGDNEKIEQDEWDCTRADITACAPNQYDQSKIEDMVGNDGDNMLSFAEYRNVMQFYENVAKQQGTWAQYC